MTQPETNETARNRLLVVDDEPGICAFVKNVAEKAGFTVATAVTHAEFRAAYDNFRPSAILFDLVMPEVDGVALLKILHDAHCELPLMIMSGYHPELLKSGKRLGDDYYLDVRGTLHKPFSVAELQEALQALGEERQPLQATAEGWSHASPGPVPGDPEGPPRR
jgi:DNA-binding response OmpR family regulator